jgi:signal transduction histidine kinase
MHASFNEELLSLLGSVVEQLPDSVRLVGRDGRTLLRNEAAREIAADGLGHLCGGGHENADPSCPACQLQVVLERGLFLRWHVLADRVSDDSDVYEVTLSPVRDSNGDVVAVLEMMRDATAVLSLENYLISRAEKQEAELSKTSENAQRLVKRAERLRTELGELRESQTEMLYQDRLEALSLFVASVAHEINTPLGAMLSSADLMGRTVRRLRDASDGIEGERASELRRRLETLESSVEVLADASQRIESILRHLRLFSRLDEAPLEEYDLHEGLDSTIELLRHKLTDRIGVVRTYGEIPRVACRPDACNQAFMNLLLNAAQSIDAKGEIRIATRLEGNEVVVEIGDTGSGIPQEALGRIFELGFTTRGGRGGSGIGLALVQRIVREHRGRVEVASRLGRGTTIRVRLPIAHPADGS